MLRSRLVLVPAALLLLGLLAAVAFTALFPDIVLAEAHPLVERLLGETPERRVAAYLGAVRRGDREAALAAWPLHERAPDELRQRRQAITDELLAIGPGLAYSSGDTGWWTNCCEPGPTNNPDNAGVARLTVFVTGGNDAVLRVYTFDVTTHSPYWGAAGGNPVRRWLLRDVYPATERPMAFPWPLPTATPASD